MLFNVKLTVDNFREFYHLFFRLEYELLANFLVDKRGYDASLKQKTFDAEADFVCKVLIARTILPLLSRFIYRRA